MNKLWLKTSRQKRALRALLEGAVAVKDIGQKIGALNARQVIFELRKQGFKDIIQTRRFTVIDQDGRLCRPGEYYIPEHLKLFVRIALEGTFQTSTKRLDSTPVINGFYSNEEIL